MNGDGFDDILVGASTAMVRGSSVRTGTAELYLGASGGVETTPRYSFPGVGSGEMQGRTVAGVGDVNGDGLDDFVVCAPLANATNAVDSGRVDLYLGVMLPLSVSGPRAWMGGAAGDQLGLSVARRLDFNGDGYSDLLVGAPYAGNSDSGASFGFLSGPQGPSSTSTFGTTGVQANGLDGWSL